MPAVGFLDPFLKTSLHAAVVIPARFASSRLPGKPLADIAGRPMIEHVYRRAAETRGIDAVVVATDDERIVAAVERFGGIARLTRAEHRSGTDRVAEIAASLACEIVVNVQGDLPLIEPGMIAELLEPLGNDPQLQMVTLRRALHDDDEAASPHVVKVVVDTRGDALYFSRAPIPFVRDGHTPAAAREGIHGGGGMPPGADLPAVRGGAASAVSPPAMYKHIGLYGFRREFLLRFAALPQTPLERAESLEQLRALEHGFQIRTVATRYESLEVDTPDDLERVRQLMAARV